MESQTARTAVLGSILSKAEFFSRVAVWAGGIMMLMSVALVSFEVVARKFFGWTISGSNELSGYVFAISTSWALAFGLLERINVRVDVLYQKLPVRISAVLDWLSLVLMGVFIGYLTYYASIVAQMSWTQQATANTTLGTPLWIPQGLWVLGMLWMCVVLALMLVRASVALVTGDLETVRAICGQRTTVDEAEEEAAMASQREAIGEAA